MIQMWYQIWKQLASKQPRVKTNNLRIFKTRFKYDLRKSYFTNRVVDAWNSLQIGLLWLTVLTLLNAG